MPSNLSPQAVYYDGKIARAHKAAIERTANGLALITTDGARIEWVKADIVIAQHPDKGQTLILANKKIDDARIVIEDEQAKEIFFAHFKGTKTFTHHSYLWPLTMITILVFAGFLLFWSRMTPVIAQHVPFSWEKALAEEVLDGMADSYGFCIKPAGRTVVQELQARLESQVRLKNPLRIEVLNRPENNAFAMPGNVVVLTHGMLRQASSLDEVAGVLAHEIGHAIEHHPTEGTIRALGFGIFLSVTLGGTETAHLPSLINTLAEMDNTRDQERAADIWAVRLMRGGGYDIGGLIHFFDRLPNNDRGRLATFFQSHPTTAERIAFLKNEITQMNNPRRDATAAKKLKELKGICGKKRYPGVDTPRHLP